MSAAKTALSIWLKHNYGKRCMLFDPSCGRCLAWACFDYLFDNAGQGLRSGGPKFRIVDDHMRGGKTDESSIQCMVCGNKALMHEEVDFIIREVKDIEGDGKE